MALRSSPNDAAAVSHDPTSWPALYERVGELFDQARLYYFPVSDSRVKFTVEMIALSASIREYAISNEEDVAAIWGALRARGQVAVDLIMQLTADIVLELGDGRLPAYINPFARAVHAIVPHTTVGGEVTLLGVTDDPFMESLGSVETLSESLLENPWLFTLCLLRRSGRMTLLRATAAGTPPAEE